MAGWGTLGSGWPDGASATAACRWAGVAGPLFPAALSVSVQFSPLEESEFKKADTSGSKYFQ